MKEAGRERVKTAGPFQVSKLQTFACNQCSGRGVLREHKPLQCIQLCEAARGHPAPGAGPLCCTRLGCSWAAPILPQVPFLQHFPVLLG